MTFGAGVQSGGPAATGRTASLTVENRLRLWAVGLLAVTLFVHGWDLATPGLLDRSGRIKGSDYMRLYVTGALAGRGDWDRYFDPESHAAAAKALIDPRVEMAGLHPNYSPTAGLALAPMSRLSFLHSYALLCLLSVVAYTGAVWLLCRNTALRAHVVTVLLVASAFPAVYVALRYGQLSAFTTLWFAAAGAAAGAGAAPVFAGALLGLAAYKPNLLVVPALVFLVAREWRLFAGLAVSGAAHLGVGLLVAGWPATREYLSVLLRLASEPRMVHGFPAELHSIPDVAPALIGPSTTNSVVVLVLTVAVVVACAVGVWRRTRDWRARWAALVLAVVLASPHVLTYDLLLFAVPILLVADMALQDRRRAGVIAWVLPGLLFFAPLLSPPLVRVTVVQVSTVATALVLLWLWQRTGSRPAPDAASLPS